MDCFSAVSGGRPISRMCCNDIGRLFDEPDFEPTDCCLWRQAYGRQRVCPVAARAWLGSRAGAALQAETVRP